VTPESDASGMALGGGVLEVDLGSVWSDSTVVALGRVQCDRCS